MKLALSPKLEELLATEAARLGLSSQDVIRMLVAGWVSEGTHFAGAAQNADAQYRKKYEAIVVRCRNTPGPCFCGVHRTPVATEAPSR